MNINYLGNPRPSPVEKQASSAADPPAYPGAPAWTWEVGDHIVYLLEVVVETEGCPRSGAFKDIFYKIFRHEF